jgi:hypothetical protein
MIDVMAIKWVWPRIRQVGVVPAKNHGGPPPGDKGGRGGGGRGSNNGGKPPDVDSLGTPTVFSSTTSASSSTFAHNATGAAVLVLRCTYHDGNFGRTISGITYDGVALTKVDSAGPLFGMRAELWYLVGPHTGSHNVVVSYTAACTQHSHEARNYINVNTSSPVGTPQKTTATAHTVSVTVTGVGAGALVIEVTKYFSSESSPNSGQVQDFEDNISSYRGAGSHKSGTGSISMGWTRDNAGNCDWAIVAVALNRG